MNRPLSIQIIILMFMVSCSEKVNPKEQETDTRPNWVLEEDKMVDIIVDLRLADAAVYINSNTPPRDKAKDWAFIMKKYGIQDSVFRKSHDYYAEHPDEAVAIYEKVIDKLSEMVADNQDN